MKQLKGKLPNPNLAKGPGNNTSGPSSFRREIDAAIEGITAIIRKDPKKAARALENWVNHNQAKPLTNQKKKAA
jgi:hypothetical protein